LCAEAEVDDAKSADTEQWSGDGEGSRPDAGDDDPGVTTGAIDAEAQRSPHGQQPIGAQYGNRQHARRYRNACQPINIVPTGQ